MKIKTFDKPDLRDDVGNPLHHQNVLNRTKLSMYEMDNYMLGDE